MSGAIMNKVWDFLGVSTGTEEEFNENENEIDPQYAMAVFEKNIETRTFQFDAFNSIIRTLYVLSRKQ